MTGSEPDRLDGDLHRRAAAAARPERRPDLASRLRELAVVTRVDDRAWVLVRAAADLRAVPDPRAALTLLDTAWSLRPAPEVERAITTVAIACHCDLGDHATAETIARQPQRVPPDLKRAYVAARLYSELFAITRDPEHRHQREHYTRLIDELELVESADLAA